MLEWSEAHSGGGAGRMRLLWGSVVVHCLEVRHMFAGHGFGRSFLLHASVYLSSYSQFFGACTHSCLC
jgi:hypothetical protein